MKVYTGQSIKNIEAACFASGITELRLMENAGVACAKVIRKRFRLEENKGRAVTILCGKGKNGGDGFVIARKLYEIGAEPTIILTHGAPTIAEPVEMLARAREMGIRILSFDEQQQLSFNFIEDAQILVDCIFGIGYHGAADPKTEAIFDAVNASEAAVVSVDVPSGLDSEGLDFEPRHIRADVTVTISAFKPVHVGDRTAAHCGDVICVSINIEKRFFDMEKAVAEITDGKTVCAILPRRAADANKGTFGHLLLLCGSYHMPGAAVFAAAAAERSGAGKITLAFPEPAYAAIASKLSEPLFLPLPADAEGFFETTAREKVIKELDGKSAVLVGCGIGTELGGLSVLETAMKRCKAPLLVDADGINLLSRNIYLLEEREEPTVLTPHLGEFAKLIGKPIEEIKANRALYACAFSESFPHTVLVLKGKNTIIACKGKILHINPTGNAGLAQGGTGDVLAGLMAGLMAQGIAPFESAVAAAFLHGEAGEAASEALSQRGMTTMDVVRFLPDAFKKNSRE